MVEVSYHFLLHISNSIEQSREGREFYFTQFSIHHFKTADNTSCWLLKILDKLHNVFSTWKKLETKGMQKFRGKQVGFFVCNLM